MVFRRHRFLGVVAFAAFALASGTAAAQSSDPPAPAGGSGAQPSTTGPLIPQDPTAPAAGTGTPIALELWALSAASFGKFVAAIPPPLSIGTVRLDDGRGIKGFLVEAVDVSGARDISSFGGWRAFMAEKVTV